MSDTRTIIDMYVDITKAERKNKTGTNFSDPSVMNLRRATQALFRCHLMLSDAVTYYQPPAGCTFLFGIDDTYAQDHADLVTSDNSQFIAADWTDSDFQNGKVCWRADLTASALKTSLGDSANKMMCCALWMTPSGELPVLLAHWDVNIRNIAVDPTTPSASPGINFDTIDRADSTYQKQKPDQGSVWFKNGKDIYIYISATGLYHPLTGVDTGGGLVQPVFGPGEAMS